MAIHDPEIVAARKCLQEILDSHPAEPADKKAGQKKNRKKAQRKAGLDK